MYNLTTNFGVAKEESFDATRCGASDEHTLSNFKYWVEGVLFTTFGFISLVGAILSIAILTTRNLRSHLFDQLL